MEYKKLIKLAIKARENAYAPYSNFKVGACLLCSNGKVFTGCNVENSSFGATNCAERTAIFSAIASGERDFEAIAIIGSNPNDYAYPCGICRQVLSEFSKNIKIIVAKNEKDYKIFSLNELLPSSFGKESM